jgi:hypothetical protein
VTLHGLGGGRRRFVGPERIDQLVRRDDFVRADREHREEHALLRTTHRDGAERSGHLEVSEHRQLHGGERTRGIGRRTTRKKRVDPDRPTVLLPICNRRGRWLITTPE